MNTLKYSYFETQVVCCAPRKPQLEFTVSVRRRKQKNTAAAQAVGSVGRSMSKSLEKVKKRRGMEHILACVFRKAKPAGI